MRSRDDSDFSPRDHRLIAPAIRSRVVHTRSILPLWATSRRLGNDDGVESSSRRSATKSSCTRKSWVFHVVVIGFVLTQEVLFFLAYVAKTNRNYLPYTLQSSLLSRQQEQLERQQQRQTPLLSSSYSPRFVAGQSRFIKQQSDIRLKKEQNRDTSFSNSQTNYGDPFTDLLGHTRGSSPFRFHASARTLSYPENALASSNSTSIHITSAAELQRYRWNHRDIIPLQEPIIYFITPTTDTRSTQMADLTILGQTLMLDGNIYWIVVEDTNTCCSKSIRFLLERIGLPYAHVAAPSLKRITTFGGQTRRLPHHKGLDQRNRGLEIVERVTGSSAKLLKPDNNATSSFSTIASMHGIVYFGDDDNTYDAYLFGALRQTKTVGVLPVGFTGGGPYERCVVNRTTGKVMSIASAHRQQERRFPIDMAGFAFSSQLLFSSPPPTTSATNQNHTGNKRADNISTNCTVYSRSDSKIRFQWGTPQGMLETCFLEQLATNIFDLDPLADNCTKLYVWHTKSVPIKDARHHRHYYSRGNETKTGSRKIDPKDYLEGIDPIPRPPLFPSRLDRHNSTRSRHGRDQHEDYHGEWDHIASRVGGVVALST
ncbi:hypothetical protein ACA910_003747 [Epithemia clementina (nom. ined.)]